MKNIFIIIIFSGIGTLTKAQNSIQELEKKLGNISGKNKFEILYQLSKAYLTISPKKSLSYTNKSYIEAKKLNNEYEQANALNMTGTAYYNQQKYKLAIKSYENELDLRKKLRQKTAYSKTLYNIASVYKANKKNRKALTTYKKTLKEAKLIKYPGLVYKSYESIISIYVNQKNYKDAFLYLQEFNSYKGTTKISFKQHKINILETKYADGVKELEEKKSQLNLIGSTLSVMQNEKETLVNDVIIKGIEINNLTTETKEQGLTITEQEAEVKRQKQWLISFAVLITVVLIFSIFLYKLYVAKKKAHNLLATQNIEIIEKSAEILVQSEQLIIRNTKIRKQKEGIIDNINYAKRIQEAILPSAEYVRGILPEYFVLLKPRDIVSGDFYWIKKIKTFTIIAVADCTGHGVSGALLSMLGTSFLNEIISPGNIDSAGKILNQLRDKVKKSLNQKGEDTEIKDGMDIALYIINNETLELQYSGAYNPLYIIRENPETELELIKADRQPIGVHIIEKDFTNHKIQLQKGNCLYSFSDGYVDQFGGENGQKFKSRNFKELLLANYKKPMNEQKQVLNNKLEEWMGHDYEQIDDIAVMGVRV